MFQETQLTQTKAPKGIIATIIIGILLFITIIILFSSFEIVQTGEKAVVLRMGEMIRVMDEGFNWKVPVVERTVTMSVRTEKIEVEALAASKDLQDVTTIIALNYKLQPNKVATIYTNVKRDYKEILIDPRIQDAVKAATAQFNAEELITKRAEVKIVIEDLLKKMLGDVNINVSGVSIVDFRFSPSFAEAIEKKVTAEQSALEQKNKLEQVKYEAQQKIETAKAEAEKTRLEVEALKLGSDIIEKIYAEASLEAAKKWNGVLPSHFVPGSTLPILNIQTQ